MWTNYAEAPLSGINKTSGSNEHQETFIPTKWFLSSISDRPARPQYNSSKIARILQGRCYSVFPCDILRFTHHWWRWWSRSLKYTVYLCYSVFRWIEFMKIQANWTTRQFCPLHVQLSLYVCRSLSLSLIGRGPYCHCRWCIESPGAFFSPVVVSDDPSRPFVRAPMTLVP